MKDPGMECELWQNDLTIILELYEIILLKGSGGGHGPSTLEMSGISKAKGNRNCTRALYSRWKCCFSWGYRLIIVNAAICWNWTSLEHPAVSASKDVFIKKKKEEKRKRKRKKRRRRRKTMTHNSQCREYTKAMQKPNETARWPKLKQYEKQKKVPLDCKSNF